MLTLGRWRFAPGLVPTLAAAAMVALTLWLANWQVDRGAQKSARQALLEAREREPALSLATGTVATADTLVFRRLRAEGRYQPEGQVFVDNRQHQGRAGFHVVTPLVLDGGGAVLVNRGWIARTAAYPQPPSVAIPEGRVGVAGLGSVPPRALELSSETIAGHVWQNLSIARYRERMRLDVLPVVLLADPPAAGLAAVRDKPDLGIAKHHEYALTWFALATTLVVLWIALNLKRLPR